MSTQRRASRKTPATEIDRTGIRRITAPLMSIIWLAWAWLLSFDEWSVEAVDRVATNSLLSDCHNDILAWHDSRLGSAPPGAIPAISPPQPKGAWYLASVSRRQTRCGTGARGPSMQRGTHRSSLTHVSLLPVRTYLRPTLPIAPAGEVRWAERHDGKRDLYFQHAA
ncbi:MAG TPA: hypothetical protein VGI45_12935 [Terracidiphilus sp.]